MEFKKGPFHLAAQTKLPIVPVVIQDAYALMPSGQLLPRPGTISVRFLPPIPYPGGKRADIVRDMSRRVRVAMLESLLDPPRPDAPMHDMLLCRFLIIPALAATIAYIVYLCL